MLGAWNGLRCSVPCQVWRTNRSPQLRHGAARVKKWRELWARKRESWCENNKKTQQRPSHIFPSLGPYLLSSLSLSLSTVVAFPSESAAAAWARLRLEPWGSLASPLRSCRLGSPALVPAAQTSDSSPLHRGMCFSEIPLVCRYKHARIHELLEIRENHELVQAPEPLCFSVICIHCLISWSS
jgi:hypothetical protein